MSPAEASARTPEAPPAVSIKQLEVTLGGNRILRDLTISFAENVTSALIGPNGAGKSTVLNYICRIIPAVSGDLQVLGVDANGLKTHQMLGIGLGRTFQGAQFVSELSVLENVKLGWHLRMANGFWQAALALPQSRRAEKAAASASMEALERVGSAHLAKRTVSELSFGDQRKIDLARALVSDPRCILLDEPMAGLSAEEKDNVSEVLIKLRGDGGPTIILVEHDMRVVNSLCPWTAVLDAGQLIAKGATSEVLNSPVVIEAYMGGGSGLKAAEDVSAVSAGGRR